MGRIYHHAGPDEFLFASEAKALLKVRPSLRGIQPDRLAEYLRYNCVLGDRTLFDGISLLPRASAWSFEQNASPRSDNISIFVTGRASHSAGPGFYSQWADAVAVFFPGMPRKVTR